MISITKTVRCVTRTPDGKEVLKEKEVKLLSVPDTLKQMQEDNLNQRDILIKIPVVLSFLTFAIPGILGYLRTHNFFKLTEQGEFLMWTAIAFFMVCGVIYLIVKVK